jgi:hypothetical protein
MNHKIIIYTQEELQNEVWKPIPNYEKDYEASNLGRIRTATTKTSYTKRHGERHWQQRILKYKSKNENTYKTGYRVDLWKNGKPKTYLVARLVASAFIKNELSNNKLTINHIDGNRLNNKIENLEWCSISDNIKKGFETGLYSCQKKIKIINKITNEENIYRSLSLASQSIGFNNGYLSCQIKRGNYESLNYKWELL